MQCQCFRRGESIRLLYAEALDGMVIEVVPAGALPRSVSHRSFRPRTAESYVVSVLGHRRASPSKPGFVRRDTMTCRRLWPDAALLAPRQKGVSAVVSSQGSVLR